MKTWSQECVTIDGHLQKDVVWNVQRINLLDCLSEFDVVPIDDKQQGSSEYEPKLSNTTPFLSH